MVVSPSGSGNIKLDGVSYAGDEAHEEYVSYRYVTVEAVPKAGMKFDSWTGEITGTTNPISVLVDCEIDATANFVKETEEPSPDPDDPYLGYEVYIPHITAGAADWVDYLQADFLGSGTSGFTLTLYGTSGEILYSANQTVDAQDKTIIDLKALNSNAMCGEITYSDPNLSFRLTQENLYGGGVAEFRLTSSLEDTIGFFFSDVVTSIAWKGFALTNFRDVSVSVTLSIMGNGMTYGTQSVTIGSKQKIVGLYTDWFPTVDFTQAQVITATTFNQGLSGVAISGDTTNSLLLFTTGAPVN